MCTIFCLWWFYGKKLESNTRDRSRFCCWTLKCEAKRWKICLKHWKHSKMSILMSNIEMWSKTLEICSKYGILCCKHRKHCQENIENFIENIETHDRTRSQLISAESKQRSRNDQTQLKIAQSRKFYFLAQCFSIGAIAVRLIAARSIYFITNKRGGLEIEFKYLPKHFKFA